MKPYIGTKLVNAQPMNRADYNLLRGWELPADENGADEGYLVEYIEGGKANAEHYAGYVSWSPADVFLRAYGPVTGMTFGAALDALKAGLRVARSGWNGKGMWLSLSGGMEPREVMAANFWSLNNARYASEQGGAARVLPCITMKTAAGEILMGWLASQSDMLSEDWEVVV